MGQGSVDYLGEDFTTTLTLGNIDLLNKTGKSNLKSQTSLCQYLIMIHNICFLYRTKQLWILCFIAVHSLVA